MKQKRAKSLQRVLVIVLALVLILGLSCSSALARVEISEKYYITDEADVISDSTEDYIVSQNVLLEQNCSGAQIVVVVVDFLDGMDIEDYCYQLFDDLDIGSDSEDNGVLLLLTIGEENYWCMQGTGLANRLSSGTIDEILWNYLEPGFAAGNYDKGVRTVFEALYSQLCSIYGVSGLPSSGSAGYDDGYYNGTENLHGISKSIDLIFTILLITTILVIMVILLYIYTMMKKRASYGRYTNIPPRPTYHPTHGPQHGRIRPSVRPRKTVIYMGGNPVRPSRPNTQNTSGGLFGGLGTGGGGSSRGGGAGRRSSGSSMSRHTFGGGGSSFGGSSRSSGMSRGGGGSSRGGGAGRRGR